MVGQDPGTGPLPPDVDVAPRGTGASAQFLTPAAFGTPAGTVPLGRLWVMGDHRGDSADSRYHGDDPGDGTIPESAVVGRAFLVIWPPSQVKSLPIPATFARRTLVAASVPVIPLSVGLVGMLPLAWARHRARGRTPAGRR